MDATEQAIDQTLRIVLSGSEYVLRLSGASAKHLAAALWSVAATQQKTRGKARLESLLKSGKELKVFNISQSELAAFSKEARKYGVLYAVVKGTKEDGRAPVDIMVKAEDASKINRIVEKLESGKFSESDVAVRSETAPAKDSSKQARDRGKQRKDADKLLLEEMLGNPKNREEASSKNPTLAKTATPHLSEPSSKKDAREQPTSAERDLLNKGGVSKTKEGINIDKGNAEQRPSVREQIEQKKQLRDKQRGKSPQDRQKQNMQRQQRIRRQNLNMKTGKVR